MRLSEMPTFEEILAGQLRDPRFREEWERTRLAREVSTERVRHRAEHGLTRAALARRAGVGRAVIAQLEAAEREPSPPVLAGLAASLGLSLGRRTTPRPGRRWSTATGDRHAGRRRGPRGRARRRAHQFRQRASAPAVVHEMLDLLDVRAGMDVLEIGTGTGYNAALMAEEAAPGRVTTVEVDPAVAEHARAALGRTGLPVTVVTGDGTVGCAEHAPYDRVMATAGALRVPYAWVGQTRPGGRIVLPWVGG